MSGCVNRVLVADEAAPPRLTVPTYAQEPCAVTVATGDAIGDLEMAYRNRGADVRECDGKRQLAIQTHTEEHRLEDEHLRLRERRQSRTCRWFGIGC